MKQATPTTIRLDFNLIVQITENTTPEQLAELNRKAIAIVKEKIYAVKYSLTEVEDFQLTEY